MEHDDPAVGRARLLATVRVQYPDTLDRRGSGGDHGDHGDHESPTCGGFELLHPTTGEPYSGDRRHLVATCRATANFALGAVAGGPDWCREAASHGLDFLADGHRGAEGFHLVVDADGDTVDRTRSAYAHAFVLLAYARATEAGLDGARDGLDRAADLLDDRFVESSGLLRSDCDPDWDELEPYRGQNANMHACEAYLAAYEATGDDRFLARARTIAHGLTVRLAAETDGLLWEHYTADWDHDFAYNADEPRHQFRPPGYQPGHHLEWAKLLALLDRYDGPANGGGHDASDAGDAADDRPENGWYARAVELFDDAVDLGWTGDGFAYTVGRDGAVRVPDRYGWAVAEGIGAAAALAERAEAHGVERDDERFREWHARLVDCAERFRGPAGLWYEKRVGADSGAGVAADPAGGDRGNDSRVPPDPPGVEPDYHPLGAWYESWRSFGATTGW
ncbi:AGE family epimerase/isomerase [Halorubrum gandharaense]